MKVITYPEFITRGKPIFLGGQTSKGDWQKEVEEFFTDTDAIFINTCRPDWDVKEPTREEKNDHIEWEFDWLDRTSVDFIVIPADAKSPTVMLELGIAIAKPYGSCSVVYIHPDYSHFHNAKIACDVFGLDVHTNFHNAMSHLKELYLTSR